MKKCDLKILINIFISIVIGLLIVFLLDVDLLKAIYEIYYGDSDVVTFFEEQGNNILSYNVRSTVMLITIYRCVYSSFPIILGIFLLLFYHSSKLPDKLLDKDFFKKNQSMGKILQISRYVLGAGVSFLILTRNRTFFNSTFHNCLLGNVQDFIRVIFSALVFLLFTLDWMRLFNDIKSFPRRHLYIIRVGYIFFISFISLCLVEFQIGSKLNILIYVFHVNLIYWIIIQVVFYSLFRNLKPGAIVSVLFAYIIGLANDIVFQFRGNYIMFGDLTVVRTALEVAGNYTYAPTKWFWISAVLLVLSIAFIILVKLPEIPDTSASKKKMVVKRVVSTVVALGAVSVFVFITFRNGSFYGNVKGVGWDYNDNVSHVGYIPYFISNMDSTRKIVLENYSVENVEKIFDNADIEDGVAQDIDTTVVEPNIILIQNEAFSDLSISYDIETDIDAMPFIHSMSENTQKGFLNMSVTGGPTANTEFEVLSRSTIQYFPYGSVPYTQYLKHDIPSLVNVLENQSNPYNTYAYHSYYSSGYNRNSVYDYMGFDNKLFENNFLKDFPKEDILRGYLSDEVNYDRVIKEYEANKGSGKPFFCFNVTIQNHGGYTGGPYDFGEKVTVTNFEATNAINTYLSLVKVSDKAFENLIKYFSEVDEPTIIMMYGDHQPKWESFTNIMLADHSAWEDPELQKRSMYYVPYVIWANFDIEESDNLGKWYGDCGKKLPQQDIKLNILSTNYVGSTLLNVAGLELSDYDKYLLDLHEDVPAITAVGVWDSEGNYYPDSKSSPFAEKLSDLEMMQYNMILDNDNKLTDHFLP